MHRLALVLLVVAGCKSSRETTCDQLAKMGTALASELGKRVGNGGGTDPEIEASMAQLKAQCMKWPDEVFDCMRDNDETSPKCRVAMQHVTGVVATDVSKAPPGPAVIATATIGETSWEGMPLVLAADGSIVAAISDSIVSYGADGTPKWRTVMKHNRWMLVEGDLVLVGDRNEPEIVALDLETGEAKWRVQIPRIDEYSIPIAEGGVRIGAAAYVPIDDARVMRVNPAACAKPKQDGCLELAFRLLEEEFDHPELFALGEDIVFAESTGIRRITTSGEVLGYVQVRDDLGGVTLAGDQKVAASIDDKLVLIDFARCPSEAVGLRHECVVRAAFDDVDSTAPAVLRDGSLVSSNWDGVVRASSAGAKQWASAVDSVGPVREAGTALVFLSRNEDETKPVRVAAIDSSTGTATWATPVPSLVSKDLTMSTEATIAVNDGWIVVGVKGRLAWLRR
jgi:outer membrane protein assembly factor BamB